MHIAYLLPVKGNVLVCGPNWLGDSVISMPALQLLRRRCPSCRITMLVKPKLESLWRMHSAVDEVIEISTGLGGTLRTARTVRARKFEGALVFPNSFRSALIPYLARVPVRVGTVGHGRVWMLTNVVRASARPDRGHQLWECLEVAGVADDPGEPPPPRLSIPEAARVQARERLQGGPKGIWIGLIPGAARGPSKQWPPGHFIEAGRRLLSSTPCRLLILGTPGEVGLCRQVAEGIGSAALNAAGETSITEFAALLSRCRVVVANDSGGMHLATAVGTRVVVVYGLTDPDKTGPLGAGHRVIRVEGVSASRDIGRDSPEAREALRSIAPEQVYQAVMDLLAV